MLGIIVYVVTLASLMAWTRITEKISLYVRKAEIRSEGLTHRGELIPKPYKLVILCLHMARTLRSNWQRLVNLLVRPHIKGALPKLRQIIHDIRTK